MATETLGALNPVTAIALVGADTLARSVAQSTEVPVGVVTALVGAPIFVFMLYRRYAREMR